MSTLAFLLLVSLSLFVPQPTWAATNATNATVNANQTFYTWVQSGETFSSTFTEAGQIFSGSGNPIVTVVRPDGSFEECVNIIVGAPFGQVCSFSEVAAVTGVYEVRLRSSDPNSSYVNAPMRWTIAASGVSGEISGRTWSNNFFMRNENTGFVPLLNLWVQTEYGYAYALSMSGLHGINSAYNADAFGVVDTNTCASAHQSSAFTANSFPNIRNVVGSSCEFTPYKVFFERPAPDLPESVTLTDGSSTWLQLPIGEPAITSLAFTPDSPGAMAGTVDIVTQNIEGTGRLQFDTDNDGDFAGPNDRQENLAIRSGDSTSIAFDGLDGDGNPIGGSIGFGVRLTINSVGEVHFTLDDIELLQGGLSVTRLNGPTEGRSQLFWDDRPLQDVAFDAQANIKCSTTPANFGGENGTDASTGVHGWDFGACPDVGSLNSAPTDTVNGGSWGNNRAIDNWAYVGVDLQETIQVVNDPPQLSLVKSADRDTYAAGDPIEYSFLLTNTGTVPVSDIAIEELSFTGSADLSEVVCPDPASLEPGQSFTCTASYTASQEDLDRGSIDNTAVANGTGEAGDPVRSNEDSARVIGDQQPKLELEKSVDQKTYVTGDTLTYTFTVTNAGNVTMRNVDVRELEFSGTGELSELTCPAEETQSLAPAASFTCTATYVTTGDDQEASELTNVARASGTPGTPTAPGVDSNDDSARVAAEPIARNPLVVTGNNGVSPLLLIGAGALVVGGIGAFVIARRNRREPR
ncbi:DUF11 domain-containing protein [Leucobacter coleopterorum]|uniref:DUF11 domain-containing protein n=1 Tax=Leucobacter coleopterorum TaxID=2714933 RepID=A0ABX6JYQ8_9MICO|nr:DUF11 domain-containing protein [Leucobacter coleopterorum]QIM19452.1 DUF11 domain-containing protein [Leucobacter coleopterorum]